MAVVVGTPARAFGGTPPRAAPWTINVTSADASGAETMIAAGGGGVYHYLSKITIMTGSNITVTVGSGESSSAVETALFGAVSFGSAGGVVSLDFSDSPLVMVENKTFTVDASGAGAICIYAEGYTVGLEYTGVTKWDLVGREYDIGRWPTEEEVAGNTLNAGANATFVNDDAHADGWTFDTADDTLWIGDTTTGTRIANNNGADAGFKIQTVEYDPGVLLKFTGSACTRFICSSSPTDIEGELDVSALTSLVTLSCYSNSITTLDVSALTSLTYLSCHSNSISTLDVSALTSLTALYCYSNSITTLDVSALTSLTALYCYSNSITTLDVSALTSLTALQCNNNSITTLDVSALTSLTYLNCSINPISALAIAALTALEYLYMYSTSITSVAAGAFDNLDALEKVYWYDCALITAVVDLCVTDFHTDRAAKAAMTTLKLAGTNEAVTGTYQAPAVPGNPANAAEAAHELVNVTGWTIEVNTA